MSLIKNLPISNGIMVSNKYPDHSLKKFIVDNNIPFILKKNIHTIKIINLSPKPDLILIDDKKLVTEIWSMEGKKFNKNIVTFNRACTLMKYIGVFDHNTSIYLDFLLENENSEQVSKNLYDLGFKNIYITTGYDNHRIKRFPWIKDIVDKCPPFSNLTRV
jgi:hypothetical protein